jgi:hypothetical protein
MLTSRTNLKENDPLQTTSEKVSKTLIAKILYQRKYQLDELSIKYKVSAITYMKQLTEANKAVLMIAPDDQPHPPLLRFTRC